MNLWGSIYIKEEEKDEEKEDEEDVIAHGLLNRSKSGSDASFGQLYEEKSKIYYSSIDIPLSSPQVAQYGRIIK